MAPLQNTVRINNHLITMMIMNTTIMIFILIIVLTSLCSLGSSSKYDSSPGYIFHIRIQSPGRIHLPHQNTVPREDTFTPIEYSPKEGYVYHLSIQSPEWINLQNQNAVPWEDIFTTSEYVPRQDISTTSEYSP